MNKKIITAIFCLGVCGILALSSIPLLDASADALFPGDTLDNTTGDFLENCGYSCLGDARSTMYSIGDGGVLTFNTSTIYNYGTSKTIYYNHTTGTNDLCREYTYFDANSTWACYYYWYEAWFTAGETVLTLEWDNALLPYAPGKIGDVTLHTPDYQFTINMSGRVYDIYDGDFQTFERNGMTYTSSFNLHSIVYASVSQAGINDRQYYGYYYFDELNVEIVATETSTDDSACRINVDYDGFGTGYTDYKSTVDGFYNTYLYREYEFSFFDSIYDAVTSFLETEFLPGFSFGALMLLALGIMVFGIGLKISLGG